MKKSVEHKAKKIQTNRLIKMVKDYIKQNGFLCSVSAFENARKNPHLLPTKGLNTLSVFEKLDIIYNACLEKAKDMDFDAQFQMNPNDFFSPPSYVDITKTIFKK